MSQRGWSYVLLYEAVMYCVSSGAGCSASLGYTWPNLDVLATDVGSGVGFSSAVLSLIFLPPSSAEGSTS